MADPIGLDVRKITLWIRAMIIFIAAVIGAFAGVAVSHRFATDKTVTVSHVDTARVTTRHENADWQVIFEVEGATSETSPTFHFTDEEMFHRYDGKQFVRISWNDVYREVNRDGKVERILVRQEFVEAY
jgi:hypothetical protein